MTSKENASQAAPYVWVPLPNSFRAAIQHATVTVFVGRETITTESGETVVLDNVLRYNQKAEGPLVSTFGKLDSIGRRDLVSLIQKLYPLLVPYFIACGTANPVHHTAYVMEFMAAILIGEGETDPFDVTVGMLAALLHDMAQGFSKLPKITERHIRDKILNLVRGKCKLDDLEAYRNDAVKARKEHMIMGAEKAGEMLGCNATELTPQEFAEIQRLIGHHDDSKIPIAYNVIGKEFKDNEECKSWRAQCPPQTERQLESIISETGDQYLLEVGDWRLQLLHEADLLWMVTQDGIEADLARFSPTEGKTWHGMIDNNITQHSSESGLYRGLPNFSGYGFQNGTAYRSKTGYALFKYLTGILRQRYP